jgi:hypothetical protein
VIFIYLAEAEAEVTLQLMVSQSIRLGVESTLWTFGQILLSFTSETEAEVTLRLTVGRSVSRSVRLGVEPTVGLAARY